LAPEKNEVSPSVDTSLETIENVFQEVLHTFLLNESNSPLFLARVVSRCFEGCLVARVAAQNLANVLSCRLIQDLATAKDKDAGTVARSLLLLLPHQKDMEE